MKLEHVLFARWLTEHWMRAGIVMALLFALLIQRSSARW